MAPRPGRRLAASGPLPRHPPAPDFLRLRRIVEVQDHHDVADVAVHLGGDVGVAPVEGEAVHARAAALPERDLARPARVGDVVDHEAAADAGRGLVRGLGLAVHQHEPVGHAHLVRVGLGRHLDGGQRPGPGRVAHVHDAGAVGRLHVGDVGGGPVHRDLAAARAVEPGDLLDALHARRDRGRHVGRSLADRGPVAKPGPFDRPRRGVTQFSATRKGASPWPPPSTGPCVPRSALPMRGSRRRSSSGTRRGPATSSTTWCGPRSRSPSWPARSCASTRPTRTCRTTSASTTACRGSSTTTTAC